MGRDRLVPDGLSAGNDTPTDVHWNAHDDALTVKGAGEMEFDRLDQLHHNPDDVRHELPDPDSFHQAANHRHLSGRPAELCPRNVDDNPVGPDVAHLVTYRFRRHNGDRGFVADLAPRDRCHLGGPG
ncbi:MAG TPA: hypothetical protein VJT32_13345 [bacterium]|nr:hypothetical protein [bacterium]